MKKLIFYAIVPLYLCSTICTGDIGGSVRSLKSIVVREGNALALWCNYTMPEGNFSNVSELSWFKDGVNITDDLLDPRNGIFQNFTRLEPLHFKGSAQLDHSGVYDCTGNLTESLEDSVNSKAIIVEYKFRVRVRDSTSWMLPGGILLTEIILIAIFTAFIWKREEAKEEAGEVEDSDDDGEGTKDTTGKLKKRIHAQEE